MSKSKRIKTAPEIEKVKYKELIKDEQAERAVKELEKLYARYPDDKAIIFDLGALLISQDIDFTKGKFLFDIIRDERNAFSIDYELGKYYLNKSMFDEAALYFKRLLTGSKSVKCKGLINLVKIDTRLGYFASALDNYQELTRISEECNFDIQYHSNILFYLLYMNGKIGEERKERYNESNYYARQVMNYDPEEVIKHIISDTDPDNPGKAFLKNYSSIDRDVDIVKLYKKCELAIQELEPKGYSITGDYYLVPVGSKVGVTINKKESEFVEVFTLPNTKLILTIHPTTDSRINRRFEDSFVPTKKLTPDRDVPFTL